MLSFLGCRGLSTSVLTPESNDGDFPSQLLSTKGVVTPEHTRGMGNTLISCSEIRAFTYYVVIVAAAQERDCSIVHIEIFTLTGLR